MDSSKSEDVDQQLTTQSVETMDVSGHAQVSESHSSSAPADFVASTSPPISNAEQASVAEISQSSVLDSSVSINEMDSSQEHTGSISTMQSNNSVDVASPKQSDSIEVFADISKSSVMDIENVSVKSEPIGEISAKFAQRPIMTPPVGKTDYMSSPARSLTPMSEKVERVSPIELVETPGGTVRIKGDLDSLPLSSTSCRSRSSSQSSKSSKGSPRHRQSPSVKSKKKKPPPKDDREVH